MKVYILHKENLRFGGRRVVKHVTSSLSKAKEWKSRKREINEYEHTIYHYETLEVEE